MATFLKLQDPATPTLSIVLNVLLDTFEEEPLTFKGVRRAAWDGTMLSTERDPRRAWRLTAVFFTVADYEAFRSFISTGVDVFTGRLTGIRPLKMVSEGADGAWRLLTPAPTVLAELGTARAFERQVAGQPVSGRRLELTLTEV